MVQISACEVVMKLQIKVPANIGEINFRGIPRTLHQQQPLWRDYRGFILSSTLSFFVMLVTFVMRLSFLAASFHLQETKNRELGENGRRIILASIMLY